MHPVAVFAEFWHYRHQDLGQAYLIYSEHAERQRIREHRAAVVIQYAWRRHVMRTWRRFLGEQATTIQRVFRGYLARKRIKVALEEHCRRTNRTYYDSMATKIQKLWRGYWSRKTVFDFYLRQRYLHHVAEKSQAVREQLQEYEQRQHALFTHRALRQLKKEQVAMATRVHHLLGTQAMPGVLGPPPPPHQPAPKHVSFHVHRPLSPTVLPKLPKRRESVTTHSDAIPLIPDLIKVRGFGEISASTNEMVLMPLPSSPGSGSRLGLGGAARPMRGSGCGTPLTAPFKPVTDSAGSGAASLVTGPAQYMGASDTMLHQVGLFGPPPKRTLQIGDREVKILMLAEKVLDTERKAWHTWMDEKTVVDVCRPLVRKTARVPRRVEQLVVADPVPLERVKAMVPAHWKPRAKAVDGPSL
ncbi:hypothetical protein GGF31_007162 [Allomyces arbusculus]|nr:hypothetical protein GGF31_007162 [Allomyces arbusculus]